MGDEGIDADAWNGPDLGPLAEVGIEEFEDERVLGFGLVGLALPHIAAAASWEIVEAEVEGVGGLEALADGAED